MAVVNIKEKTSLKLELDDGMVNGRQRIRTKSFNKIKTTASDEGLYETAIVLGNLQSKEVVKVKRVEETALVSE